MEIDQLSKLLKSRRCLNADHIDDGSGPRKSSAQVANFKTEEWSSWPAWIHELEEHTVDEISTDSERDANYVHAGWPTRAEVTVEPWLESRIARCPQPMGTGPWVTKRVSIRRLMVDIPLEELTPSSSFVAEVEEALCKFAESERFLGLREVFDKWGDVLALAFEFGTSASVTGPPSRIKVLDESPGLQLGSIAAFPSVRTCIQGGVLDIAHDDLTAWLSKSVPPERWAKIKVTRVVPITALLPASLQSEVKNLYAQLISYRPELDAKMVSMDQHVDGSKHALKTIDKLVLHAGNVIQSILVNYLDGTQSHLCGETWGKEQVFSLEQDEFVVEVATWLKNERLSGLRFTTSKGRISQIYGRFDGQPTVYSSPGGVLVALSADLGYDEDLREMLCNIQTIWRHDVIHSRPSTTEICSGYVGGVEGDPFDDRRFLHNSLTAHVSGFKIRSGSYVHRIQATYKGYENRKPFVSPSWPHGGAGGLEESFQLGQGEYITSVSGRHDGSKIIQLCFKTNRGRTSAKYGQTSGRSFQCKPPTNPEGRPMRLRYIVGKSSKCLNGIMFVWAPVEY